MADPAEQTLPEHTCHVPHCNVPVPRRMLMCRRHWGGVPGRLRQRVYLHYVAGQENWPLTGEGTRPSLEYLHAADAAIAAALCARPGSTCVRCQAKQVAVRGELDLCAVCEALE